jgi:DNA modification methylase
MSGHSSREDAIAALNQSKKIQQDISNLQDQISRLRCVTKALWELIQNRLNLTEKDLQDLVAATEEKMKNRTAEPCPACGRALQDNQKICIFCGAQVTNRPIF